MIRKWTIALTVAIFALAGGTLNLQAAEEGTVSWNAAEHLQQPVDHDHAGTVPAHAAYWSWAAAPLSPIEVTYYIKDLGGAKEITPAMDTNIRNAVDTWNSVAGAEYLTIVEIGTDTADITITNDTRDGPGGNLGRTNISFTAAHQSPDYPDGTPWHRILSTTVTMDYEESWYAGSGAPGVGEFDYESVMLHELGHAIGLGHAGAEDPGSVMWPTIGTQDVERTPSAQDSIILASLYGHPEPATLVLFASGLLLILRKRRKSAA